MPGIFFTRTDKAFRAWFQAVRSTGELRTGFVNGDFIINVVNALDTATTSPTVTESTQKPGFYYFDIPSSFFYLMVLVTMVLVFKLIQMQVHLEPRTFELLKQQSCMLHNMIGIH